MAPRTLVVHATNLLVRGFLTSAPGRQSDSGGPTQALFVLTRALRRAFAFKQPDVGVAVVDAPATCDDWATPLRDQAGQLETLLEAHGLHVVPAADSAALVASYVQVAVETGHDVVVVSSDKRMAQLVGDRVWWYDAYKDVRYTAELVRKRFDVGPQHVAEWLALVGDDGALPGVKGIGKKGAGEIIGRFGSVKAALAELESVDGRTGKALRSSPEVVARELERAQLNRHQPLPVSLDELACRRVEPGDQQRLYGQLGFLELLSAPDAEDTGNVAICATPEQVHEALAALDGRPVALHVVTEDPSSVRGDLIGLALAQHEPAQHEPAQDGAASSSGATSLYIPFTGKRPCLAEGQQLLAPFLADASRAKVGHDVKAVVVAFARQGIDVAGIVGDSACASHLAEPSTMAPHDLSPVARQVLRRAVPDDQTVRGVGRSRKRWSEVAVERTASFAGELARAAAALWDAFEPITDRTLLTEYLELSATLTRMELRGIACDADDLARVGEDFDAIRAELEQTIYKLAGKQFNLGSTKQLGSVLFEDLALPVARKTKTGWSTATDALERIEHAHPVVPLVIRWRRLRFLTDNWVTALRASIDGDGRVRSTFHPARSFSGRIINSSPDLGRVPGTSPENLRIRHAFHAPPGSTLLSVDYRQLGLYVLAHLSKDPALVEPLRRDADMHQLTASAVLELPVEAIGPAERQTGKVVNFATFAGQGASALALQLGVSAQESKLLIERFDRRFSVVRAFQEEQLQLARERGYIETIAGRRWPLGDLDSRDQMKRAYAERLARRATHEGSVSDVSRRGLLRADQALRAAGLSASPLLQVLDEVLFEVRTEEVASAARVASEAMCTAFATAVPLRVGCKAGPNWAELEPLPEIQPSQR